MILRLIEGLLNYYREKFSLRVELQAIFKITSTGF